jgi:hypothetical protein
VTDPNPPRCLICETPISLFLNGAAAVPVEAVAVSIPGSNGSSLFQGGTPTYLRAYICDDCLESKGLYGLVQMVRITADEVVRNWRPGREFAYPKSESGRDRPAG